MHTEKTDIPSGRAFARFFIPLALQSASQGLTYPLVAMVASRGAGGPLNLAGLAQSNTVMYLLGTMGFGLITTGMVYGRNLEGYRQFRTVTLRIALFVISIQALLGIPYAAHLLFGRVIGLPPSIAGPAQITLLACVPLQFLFFMRIPYQVSMYNVRRTARASAATILRIALTAVLSPIFCLTGLVGPLWAIVCLTIPVALEVAMSRWLAGPSVRDLKSSEDPLVSKKEMFLFNLPLSIGGYLLSLSAIMLGAFIARAAEPERMLPVYHLALGLATPLAFGATRTREVVLAFMPAREDRWRTLVFTFYAGLVMGMLPLIFTLPGICEMYYVKLQNLSPEDLNLVRLTAVALVFYPFCVAIRAQGEGLAGLVKKPMTVIAGQAVFMGTVVVTGGVSLTLGLSGNFIGPLGLVLGNLASTITLRLVLGWAQRTQLPVPITTTSSGQIR